MYIKKVTYITETIGSRFSTLSKARIISKFCMPLGPTETQLMPWAPVRNNVSLPMYGVAEIHGHVCLDPSVSRTTVLIVAKLASVCSTVDRTIFSSYYTASHLLSIKK